MNLFAANQASRSSEEALCRHTQERLSDYVDNTLSARHVWEVEKHLAACPDCMEVSRQMRATVDLTRSAARFDTGDDFMARLHARLDDLEPAPARRPTLTEWLQDVVARTRAGLSVRHAPGLSLGMGAAGVVALLFLARPLTVSPPPISAPAGIKVAVAVNPAVQENLQRNVAFSANDPLGDVAAEYLENVDSADNGANSAGSEGG